MSENAVSDARVELDAFLSKQQELGAKRRDIALVMFARGYSEAQVGKVMGINPKSAHAMKVDFSKKGKEAREKKGKRLHLDPSKAQLKRVEGKKMLTVFVDLVEKVLAEGEPKETAHE